MDLMSIHVLNKRYSSLRVSLPLPTTQSSTRWTVSREQMKCTRNKNKERTRTLPDHVNKATEWLNERMNECTLFFFFVFLNSRWMKHTSGLFNYWWTTSRTCKGDALQKHGYTFRPNWKEKRIAKRGKRENQNVLTLGRVHWLNSR